MSRADAAGNPELEVRLLGPIEVERRGEPVALGGQKPKALLAVLALEPGRVVSIDRLVEALWPGDPPETAAHAVQVYVSQLRKALGPVITTRAPGYELELEPERIDVHRFERLATEGREALRAGGAEAAEGALREALALWQGPVLADFLYEPFAQSEIARLEELRTVVLEERIEADLALGRHAELVSELEALVQAQPLRERPRAQLMLALYRSGRQADALAAYRDARATLVDELGINPGAELRELEAAILRQDASLLLEGGGPTRPAMQFRRLASILFVDIVDSMSLGEKLDPEALGAVQRSYFETVSAALIRHGGTVEKYAGDAVMAAFGVPVSHEDDALRAARAAFDIRAGVAALNEQLEHSRDLSLRIRIGIAAGEVVATSDTIGQRFVAGDPVGIAARLQQDAEPGEIVVGEVVARLIDHAAQLEARGALEIAGREKPFAMYVLHDLEPVAPVFVHRLDAPLVGRKRELAALRRSLKRTLDDGSARVALVVASPGGGKSRLAAELVRRTKGVKSLWGRCLSYGDGITYWPLRELIAEAAPSEERDAVIAALEAEPPPPPAEIALLFRRFCEALTRERPLLLVIDDVHWAEPTFLDLVEHLAEKSEAPILVVCVAREELLEERPSFLEGRKNVDRVTLDPLSPHDAETLLDGLGASSLESDQRARITEAAEGNPLFLEQLLALALEGGLASGDLPETIQALLAARLDRLGPGERAVLERGAVVGKEFRLDDVVALLDPGAAPTAEAHIDTLAARGFVRPSGEGGFGFRHVLVRDAVYRAAPKRLRAELHERFADRLDADSPELPELDEFVGYHLERAYQLHAELGASDRRTATLSEDAGRRLAMAGLRALRRGDMPATIRLLSRAVALLPVGAESRHELMCELGIAYMSTGDIDACSTHFREAAAAAARCGHRRAELRAQVEVAYARLVTEPEGAAAELLAVAERAVPAFEAFEDDRSLARVWMLTGYVAGGIGGRHAAWEEAEERALTYYRRTAFPTATCLQQLAAAIYWGPTPVPFGISRCTELSADETIGVFGRASILPLVGGLHAQLGEFAAAREFIDEAEHELTELGASAAVAVFCGAVRSDLELLAGDLAAAEATLRDQCEYFERSRNRVALAARAAKLAETLYRHDRLKEARQWAAVSRANTASDDMSTNLALMPVEAKLLAREGLLSEARQLADEAVRLADETDGLNVIASTRLALAAVLRVAKLDGEAETAIREAIALFEQKGNVVAATRARDLLDLEVVA